MTVGQYESAVALVEMQNPDEALLPTLRRGYLPVNEVYLRHALKRLPAELPAPDPREEQPHPRNQRYADLTLKGLWGERSRLFGEMNKLSNKFHDCKSDDERAANSRRIGRIWGQILEVKTKIEYYEAHGEEPEPEADEERFPLPSDPVALVRKQSSIRAQISQVRKRLDDLGALPDGHPDREKIAECEARLKELKLYLGHAARKISDASVHAG